MRHRAPVIRLAAALGCLSIFSPWSAARAAPQSVAELAAKAQHGDPVAQFDLATRLDRIMANRSDRARALDLYCHAARSGHAGAAFGIGRMFFGGRGVQRD